jgi:hypothetical protein
MLGMILPSWNGSALFADRRRFAWMRGVFPKFWPSPSISSAEFGFDTMGWPSVAFAKGAPF